MSTLKGTTMHPRCRHIGACWDLLEGFQLFSTSQNTSRIQFRTFLKKKQISGFPWCSTREDLSIDVSITTVGLILTKLRWFQLFAISQISNFELFWKKIQIFGFPLCSTCENLSIDASITNVGLILTKLRGFLFSGCGQTDGRTDRQGFGILIWKHVDTQKISTQSSKLVVSRRSLYASPEVGDA